MAKAMGWEFWQFSFAYRAPFLSRSDTMVWNISFFSKQLEMSTFRSFAIWRNSETDAEPNLPTIRNDGFNSGLCLFASVSMLGNKSRRDTVVTLELVAGSVTSAPSGDGDVADSVDVDTLLTAVGISKSSSCNKNNSCDVFQPLKLVANSKCPANVMLASSSF